MVRRNVSSVNHSFRVAIQAVICAAGLLGGLVIGAAIIYLSGLWHEFGSVLKTPVESMTKTDLMMAAATVMIVFGCGWVGVRLAMQRAARIET